MEEDLMTSLRKEAERKSAQTATGWLFQAIEDLEAGRFPAAWIAVRNANELIVQANTQRVDRERNERMREAEQRRLATLSEKEREELAAKTLPQAGEYTT